MARVADFPDPQYRHCTSRRSWRPPASPGAHRNCNPHDRHHRWRLHQAVRGNQVPKRGDSDVPTNLQIDPAPVQRRNRPNGHKHCQHVALNKHRHHRSKHGWLPKLITEYWDLNIKWKLSYRSLKSSNGKMESCSRNYIYNGT